MSRLGAGEINDLVKQVSRSFYLTLRILPRSIRPQISLAYLLARTTDTIADTRLVSADRRAASLSGMKAAIAGAAQREETSAPDFALPGAAPGRRLSAESLLLAESHRMLETLRRITEADRQRICEVLDIIISGQQMDLERFGRASSERLECFRSDSELDDYTYRVAGCVGEFWTRMCRAHLFPRTRISDEVLQAGGARFGKGLQLINILRDIPADLQRGRCYIPALRLADYGLLPGDLLDKAAMPRFRPLFNEYLGAACEHLAVGWKYTLALPRGQVRIRLACAWPILIGLKTIRLLRLNNVLDAGARIKITRSEIRRLVVSSILRYPWTRAWDRQFELFAEE